MMPSNMVDGSLFLMRDACLRTKITARPCSGAVTSCRRQHVVQNRPDPKTVTKDVVIAHADPPPPRLCSEQHLLHAQLFAYSLTGSVQRDAVQPLPIRECGVSLEHHSRSCRRRSRRAAIPLPSAVPYTRFVYVYSVYLYSTMLIGNAKAREWGSRQCRRRLPSVWAYPFAGSLSDALARALSLIGYCVLRKIPHWLRCLRHQAMIDERRSHILLNCDAILLACDAAVRGSWHKRVFRLCITNTLAGIKGRGKRESPEKTCRPKASSGTIPTCENPAIKIVCTPGPTRRLPVSHLRGERRCKPGERRETIHHQADQLKTWLQLPLLGRLAGYMTHAPLRLISCCSSYLARTENGGTRRGARPYTGHTEQFTIQKAQKIVTTSPGVEASDVPVCKEMGPGSHLMRVSRAQMDSLPVAEYGLLVRGAKERVQCNYNYNSTRGPWLFLQRLPATCVASADMQSHCVISREDASCLPTRFACLPPTKGEPSSIPGFSHVGIVPDDAAGTADFLGDLPFLQPLHSGTAPYKLHFPLIGSQDLVLNSTVLYILKQTSFLHWLLHRSEATPFLTELQVIGAHNCEVFIYWHRVTQGVSDKVRSNGKRIATSQKHSFYPEDTFAVPAAAFQATEAQSQWGTGIAITVVSPAITPLDCVPNASVTAIITISSSSRSWPPVAERAPDLEFTNSDVNYQRGKPVPPYARGWLDYSLPTKAEGLDCSPPTEANRVHSSAGSLQICAYGNRAGLCCWSPGPGARWRGTILVTGLSPKTKSIHTRARWVANADNGVPYRPPRGEDGEANAGSNGKFAGHRVLSGISRFVLPCISALLYAQFASSAFKSLLLKVAQISLLHTEKCPMLDDLERPGVRRQEKRRVRRATSGGETKVTSWSGVCGLRASSSVAHELAYAPGVLCKTSNTSVTYRPEASCRCKLRLPDLPPPGSGSQPGRIRARIFSQMRNEPVPTSVYGEVGSNIR
ncbi:hypothetical protein PR048_001562 [Dryococelus australis]|uniref:Uncharacterized protein n=1 Tax=Dryococelus australis TaxID=614101 RepID=A0ABQ9IHV8_9NEOP|nr:hypothetical protein PR048_001562 [Dryococelus australis]